jgi:putative copper resistance protein D
MGQATVSSTGPYRRLSLFTALTHWVPFFVKGGFSALSLVVLPFIHPADVSEATAQQSQEDHAVSYRYQTAPSPELHHADAHVRWEGSARGVAYSQFNHRFAGLCILLIGLSELVSVLRCPSPLWTRLILVAAFGVVGPYLLIWSDHEAWPVGSMSFAETYFGQDPEILQHKYYGILATTVAVSEFLRRVRWVNHPAWAVPLPFYAVSGGLLLFVHSHGVHPEVRAIDLHHAIMGTLAVSAGATKSIAGWVTGSSSDAARGWNVAWVGLIFLIGIQLLLYFE